MLQVGLVKWHQLNRATNLWATCRVLWWLGLGICNRSQVQEILLKLSLIPEDTVIQNALPLIHVGFQDGIYIGRSIMNKILLNMNCPSEVSVHQEGVA
jgi:hypothetical protein